ncbi:MAG: hypothetical protein Q9162_005691 [Coniocarpon cinnabarinum]
MTSFAQAFWSNDYAGGLGVLFGKLQQGVQENQQILTVARMRADAEELYGQHMGDIGPACDKYTDGFTRDDGASVRKAYDGVRTEMEQASIKHRKIATNIRELVVYPFGRWCDQHANRVQNSQDELQARIKAHDKQADWVRKLRSAYFNKCRLVEDLEEEDKLAFQEPTKSPPASTSPKLDTPTVKIHEPDPDEDEKPVYEIGDDVYEYDQMKKILTHMLNNVRLGETKVPILGTYQNVSTGSEIVEYIQKHLNGTSISYAERVGQDLVNCGFLRLIGNVGSVFANSSRMNYQWRTKAFQMTGMPEKKQVIARSSTLTSNDAMDGPVSTVREYLEGWNPLNNPYPNETPGQKLRREAREADEKYKAGVRKLDLLRCTLEEAMIEHLKFMERCELDRLKAIKSVILDFSGAVSNVIPSLQSTVDKMMLFQETVQPLGDLRYMLENYRTGPFIPKVQPYENYYNSVADQTFGIDLEARARADKKRVPLLVTGILTHLDNTYPLLDGDEARQSIWTVDVPLAATHRLRNDINTGQAPSPAVLQTYETPIVASVLKLYLLELPDSIVSSSLYEIIKTIYTSPTTASDDQTETRVSVLQNTLGQLRLANIATLDALCTHFARLIDLTSASDDYVTNLITILAPCVLRSRTESAMLFEEKYNVRFLKDLLAHKDAIFGELKRSATLQHSASVARAQSTIGTHLSNSHHPSAKPESAMTAAGASIGREISPDGNRARAISTDESNRRAHMEERNRAIASRSRAASPAPGSREHFSPSDTNHLDSAASQSHRSRHSFSLQKPNHRRDSSRGPETRFPVAPSGQHATITRAREGSTPDSPKGLNSPRTVPRSVRDSLEVPGSPTNGLPNNGVANGTTAASNPNMSATSGPFAVPAHAPTNSMSDPPPVPPKEHRSNTLESAADDRSTHNAAIEREGPEVQKQNSLSRGKIVGRKGTLEGAKRSSLGSLGGGSGRASLEEKGGVELVDKPMDD